VEAKQKYKKVVFYGIKNVLAVQLCTASTEFI
jgi:hypothetical protein